MQSDDLQGIIMDQRTRMFDPISVDQIKIQGLLISLLECKPMPCQSTKVVKCFSAMNAKNGATNATSVLGKQHHWPRGEINNRRGYHSRLEPHKFQEDAVDHSKVADQTK